MRITILSKAFVVGAYQRKLEALAAQPDIELTAIVPTSWREAGREHRLEIAHTSSYSLVTAPIALNGSFHLHWYPTLAAILRKSRPDICHIDEEPYNLATYLAARKVTRLGAQPFFFTWQNLLRSYPWPFSAMEQYNYRHCRAAIAGNEDAAAVLRKKGYRGAVAVIPQFGVDPDLFQPAGKAPSAVFTIGYAGRLVEQKGLMVLLEALTMLEGEWRLAVSGAGPLAAQMQAYLAEHRLLERVTFHQHIPSGQMPAFYAGLDVLVLPSLSKPNWKEQFGRVLIEAMACGVPVVGSDSGEIPRVIADGGLITPEGRAEALAQALARLRDDSSLRQKLGRAGRERVLATYTHTRIAQATCEVYRWLARGSNELPAWDYQGKGTR